MSATPVSAAISWLESRRVAALIAALGAAQAMVWIALAGAFEGSVRLDVAEGVVDGPQGRLSYLRHPPFSSWLTGLATHAGAFRYLAVYAIGLTLSVLAFWLVAQFLRGAADARSAWTAAAAGLASPYATYVPLQVNHNIGVMPFWAAALWAGWRALSRGAPADWALYGAAVGLGLWAKYAILHLIAPIAVYFLADPTLRRRAVSSGPWLAAAVAALIAAPHFADALANGATTLAFAARTMPAGPVGRLLWIGEFALDCLLAQTAMALIAWSAAGGGVFAEAWRPLRRFAEATPFERYLAVASFGPPALVLAAALIGVHPHYLWLTPFTLGFCAYWGAAAARTGTFDARRLALAFGAFAGLLVVAYVGMREIAPRLAKKANYADMDGPGLAKLAQGYWAERHPGRIPFLVSLGLQRGFQAAGSIAFDLPYRVETLEEGEPGNSPWFDVTALKRAGALVVSTAPIAANATAAGAPIRAVEAFKRPMLRGGGPEPIYFGEMGPSQ